MSFNYTCTSCGKTLQVKDHMAGKRVRCPSCSHEIELPLSTEDRSLVFAAQPDVGQMVTSSVRTSPAESTAGRTKVSSVLALRGNLVRKETKPIAIIKCPREFGTSKIEVGTMIVSILSQGHADTDFGVRLEATNDDGTPAGAAFVDFDETQDVLNAITLIGELAAQILDEPGDYTEITYKSKDDMHIGFYQAEITAGRRTVERQIFGKAHTNVPEQQPFMKVGSSGETVFLTFDELSTLGKAIENARRHLISKGAEQEK